MDAVPVENPIAPAIAPEPTGTVANTPRALSDLSQAERAEWRKTGKFPDAHAASSTAPAVEDPPAVTAATSEPASEPAENDPDYKPKTAKRIKDLLAEIERLKSAPAQAPKSAALPAPAAAAPASTLVKPDPEKFLYGTADPDYLEALTDYKVAKTLESERAATVEQQRRQQTEDAIAETNRSWTERRTAAEAKYPDFKDVALAPFKPGFEIPSGSVIDAWILESEHGADVLYALMKNPADIRRINALKSHAQARELTLLEQKALTPPKTVTSAPEPGPYVGVRAGDPAGASARALRKGDFATYAAEENRKALAAKHKGH